VHEHTLIESLISLATLTLLEIVLGIDNLVIISILSEKLPDNQKSKARKVGLALALITRILLLTTLTWLSSLTITVFTIGNNDISIRDLVLLIGGLFLLYKASKEIYKFIEAKDDENDGKPHLANNFIAVVASIIFFDIVFSFDSVLTAVGLARQLWIMITAVIIAVIFMLIFVDQVCEFIDRNPTIKLLALAFLIMVGALLVAEGLNHPLSKNMVYFSMGVCVILEMIRIRRESNIKKRLSVNK
jgi:predicted tellurium resistance membrane protein TerC